jgi:hypothetical protein
MAAAIINEVKPTKMFDVLGPFAIEPTKAKSARRIEKDQKAFWEAHPEASNIAGRIGCYVFGIQAGRGIRPVYIGKTTKSFVGEVFGSHQRDYYNAELASITRGKPVMFFVLYPKGKGKPNSKMIKDVEEFLTQVAVARNPNLRNIQNIGEKKWGISGVIRPGKGKPTDISRSFKKALGIRTK